MYITETTDYSWKDGVQLQDMWKQILSYHFFKFSNNSIDTNFDNCLWINESPQPNDVSSDIKDLIDICKRFPYNPIIGYININYLKEKVIPLRKILSTDTMFSA